MQAVEDCKKTKGWDDISFHLHSNIDLLFKECESANQQITQLKAMVNDLREGITRVRDRHPKGWQSWRDLNALLYIAKKQSLKQHDYEVIMSALNQINPKNESEDRVLDCIEEYAKNKRDGDA